jgi:hypothetical protein
MAGIIQVKSSSIVKKCQIIIGYLFGKFPQSFKDASNYGIDSCPINDSRGVYVSTTIKGRNYIVGYVTTERKTSPGEIRIFSTNLSGDQLSYLWFKSTGTIEFNGNVDNLVRYTPLNSGLQAEVVKINTNLNAILVNLTALNIAVNGLVPGAVPTPYVVTPVDVNITNSKTPNIKTE